MNKDNQDENRKLQELYSTSDLYLQPSIREAQGIAYAEASAFGLPVIAVNTGGVSDIVAECNGLLFEPEYSVETYVNRIKNLLYNRSEYRELCILAYKFYKEKLNWKCVGEKITQTLESLINK